ncbi:DUF6223 family protein [Streptomyces sp. NPDC003035]|uniref:DUF6223 family protein n=1 Tax=Streptomyces sp. NPDC003035 TaxID=3364676 RepID=UPI0036A63E7B
MSVGFLLAAPAVAADVTTMSAGRLGATTAALVALAGVVVGGLALARSTGRIGRGPGRGGSVTALVTGLFGIVLGAVVVTTSDGGLGTGNGLGGGVVALVVGLVGVAIGALGMARSRRTARPAG